MGVAVAAAVAEGVAEVAEMPVAEVPAAKVAAEQVVFLEFFFSLPL